MPLKYISRIIEHIMTTIRKSPSTASLIPAILFLVWIIAENVLGCETPSKLVIVPATLVVTIPPIAHTAQMLAKRKTEIAKLSLAHRLVEASKGEGTKKYELFIEDRGPTNRQLVSMLISHERTGFKYLGGLLEILEEGGIWQELEEAREKHRVLGEIASIYGVDTPIGNLFSLVIIAVGESFYLLGKSGVETSEE